MSHRVPAPSARRRSSSSRPASLGCSLGDRRRARRRLEPADRRRRRRDRPTRASRRPSSSSGSGYIPSVQFAQFYLAQQNGYYADGGPRRRVPEQDRPGPHPARRRRARSTSGSATGRASSRRPATASRSSTSPRSTASSRTSSSPRRRPGSRPRPTSRARRSACPGRYGSGWIMLQALLASAGLTTDDVEIVEYPDFTQEAAVEQGAVDAATGFANNEPIQLELHGEKAGRPARSTTSRRCPGPGSSRRPRRSTRSTTRSRRSWPRRSRRWTRSRPTRRSGSTRRSTAVPELASARDAQAAILAATIDVVDRARPGRTAASARSTATAGRRRSRSWARSGWSRTRSRPTTLVREDLLPAGD